MFRAEVRFEEEKGTEKTKRWGEGWRVDKRMMYR